MGRFSLFRFLAVRPYIVSLIIILILSIWLGLGTLKADDGQPEHQQEVVPLAKVAFQTFTAQSTHKSLSLIHI